MKKADIDLIMAICETVPHATTMNKNHIFNVLSKKTMWSEMDILNVYNQITTWS